MSDVLTSKINLLATNGVAVFKNYLSSQLFLGMEKEISLLMNATYSTNNLPLRTWWMQDDTHFKKIDQVHHCSQKLYDVIKQTNFESILKPLYKKQETCQVWSSSLYICPPHGNNTSSVIGLHSDNKFTPFIEGDYFVALLPLTEVNYENTVFFEKSFNYKINPEFLDPLAQNINEQLTLIENEYGLRYSKNNLSKGDLLITHSRCIKGILPNLSTQNCSYLIVYFRSEENIRKNTENHFGMCDSLDDLLLSPILFHQKQ